MSEHMQLSLALCRIGIYTVRKCMHSSMFYFMNVPSCICVCAGLNDVSLAMVEKCVER